MDADVLVLQIVIFDIFRILKATNIDQNDLSFLIRSEQRGCE